MSSNSASNLGITIEQLKTDIKKETANLLTMQAELATATAEKQSQEASVKGKESEIKQKETEIQKLKADISQIKTKFSESDKKIRELTTGIATARQHQALKSRELQQVQLDFEKIVRQSADEANKKK
jgi:septal ring factor EnvC (AmiA/AmiB activator)